MNLTLDNIKAACIKKGYKWFDDINIVWVRTADQTVNVFNDFCTVSWKENGIWKFIGFKGTTDPGLYYLKNPINVNGTAIVKPGQYIDCWKRGLHKGHYALIQVRPITVYRDRNKDGKIDYSSEETGLFGINSHRASSAGVSTQVDKWSAGCQVLANTKAQDRYMEICDYANRDFYTFTLLEEKDL